MQQESEQKKRQLKETDQKEIKMRRIMQHTFQQLQLQKIKQNVQLMYDIDNLKQMNRSLEEKTYAEVEIKHKYKVSQEEVEKAQAKKLYGKMELISKYLALIAVNKKDPVLKKTRSSPFPSHHYFQVYHDLEVLNIIKPPGQKATQEQTIADCLDKLREYMIKWPKREEVMPRAKQLYKEMNEKQDFEIKPSLCETMTADQFQQEVIYMLDDLLINFDWEEKENKAMMEEYSIILQEQPQLSFIDKLQQLERQLTQQQKIHKSQFIEKKHLSDTLFL